MRIFQNSRCPLSAMEMKGVRGKPFAWKLFMFIEVYLSYQVHMVAVKNKETYIMEINMCFSKIKFSPVLSNMYVCMYVCMHACMYVCM